jgi:hypothetical protein
VISYPRFLKAASKAKQDVQFFQLPVAEINEQLFIKVDSILHSINANDILWIESLGRLRENQYGRQSDDDLGYYEIGRGKAA